jgi:hypothetical protein
MNNQVIGIAGMFALTFVLFVILHCFLSLGRPNRRRYVKPMTLHRDYESSTNEDNAWLWSPEFETRAGPAKPSFREDPNRSGLRS